MDIITVNKSDKILKGRINLPSSKSISNRVLIIKALIKDDFSIQNLSEADDTVLMENLHNKIKTCNSSTKKIQLDCKNAGTVFRFLTAYLSITPGKWFLTGTERIKQRPIKILVDSLKQIGAKIDYVKKEGYPPLLIEGSELTGGELEIDGSISSQFITALLLIAAVLPKGLKLVIKNKISSLPYIEMTIRLLELFGVESNFRNNTITIRNQSYTKTKIIIELDWTAASYWYEMAAFATEVDITLIGLKKDSLQGDSILPDIYENFGVKTEFAKEGIRLTKGKKVTEQFEFDFTHYPDIAQSVIVTCAGLNIQGKFTGLESLKIKETDRLYAVHNELQKLGFETEVFEDSEFRTTPIAFGEEPGTKNQEPKIINTYGDHRMAMAFAPLALIFDTIRIENPIVVSKSYPGFWKDLDLTDLNCRLI